MAIANDVIANESANDVSSPFYRQKTSGILMQGMNKRFNLVKQKIARFYIPDHDDNSPSSSEDFYRRLCLLFIPWRDETALLGTFGQETYFETFMADMEQLKTVSVLAHADIVKCLSVYRNFKKDQREARSKAEQIKEFLQNARQEADVEEFQVERRIVNATEHEAEDMQLNAKQLQLFELVMDKIREMTQFSMYCSGTAGVGKSFAIKCIAHAIELEIKNQPDV